MRGNYYHWNEPRPAVAVESAEDRNARENKAKQDAGQGPQVIAGPETPFNREDLSAIVRHVALQVLLNEVDYSERDLRAHHPALAGITSEQLRSAILEDLS
jgi:hypothetical protein